MEVTCEQRPKEVRAGTKALGQPPRRPEAGVWEQGVWWPGWALGCWLTLGPPCLGVGNHQVPWGPQWQPKMTPKVRLISAGVQPAEGSEQRTDPTCHSNISFVFAFAFFLRF